MKYIIIVIFLFLFVSCDCKKIPSTYIDKRCEKIWEDMWDNEEKGACDLKPEYVDEKGNLKEGLGSISDYMYKTREACWAFLKSLGERCDALPPPGPDDIEQTSGSYFGGGCK